MAVEVGARVVADGSRRVEIAGGRIGAADAGAGLSDGAETAALRVEVGIASAGARAIEEEAASVLPLWFLWI